MRVDQQEHRSKTEKNIDRERSWFYSIHCQVDTSTTESNSVMAAEFVLIPKHKYEQLEKDSTPKNGNLSTPLLSPPSDDPTDNDNQSDLSHEGPDNSNTDDNTDISDVSDILESFNSTELKYVQPIITLMENNTGVLTWNRKTGEIVFLQQLV